MADMIDLETEVYNLIAHIETYVDPFNLVMLTERQRELIVKALDGHVIRQEEMAMAAAPPQS